MNTTWHSIKNVEEDNHKKISAESTIDSGSLWFNGHFPNFPILPGIAQLAVVSEALKENARAKGKSIIISEIKKVRFRQFVRPNDTMNIVAAPDESDPNIFKFKVLIKGQIACNGVMVTALQDKAIE